MIYLIDDKKFRQKSDYNWTRDLFEKYSKQIIPIYDLETLKIKSKKIFEVGNTVLYHESFMSNTVNNIEAIEQKNKFEDFARNNSNFQLVIFSGGKDNQRPNKNILDMYVDTLYQNLELFITDSNKNLETLTLGKYIELEKQILETAEAALDIEEEKLSAKLSLVNSNNYFIFTISSDNDYSLNLSPDIEEQILYQEDISEKGFDHQIKTHLNTTKYNVIYIPLCVGPYNSYFNGLKLATILRCTESINQLSNIVIYGYIDYSLLVHNEYFDILKTKNVKLVNVLEKNNLDLKFFEKFETSELSFELSRMSLKNNLKVDDHGFANEWGILLLAQCAEINIDDIIEFDQNKLTQIYFKWILAKNSLNLNLEKEKPTKKVSSIPRLKGLNIQGHIDQNILSDKKILLIDDNANKGWGKLLENLFSSKKIKIDPCLNEDGAVKKIEDEYDLIFLDMRLSDDDLEKQKTEQITGYKILKSIRDDFKHINFSTPIILLTASNKIWNVHKFIEFGIDSFYIKEHPNSFLGLDNSKANCKKLKKDFDDLIKEIGPQRKVFWGHSIAIINSLSNHEYFSCKNENLDKRYETILKRINAKLKLGYNYMFAPSNLVQKNVLAVDNESMSFIIIYSILEEIVKGFTEIHGTWNTNPEQKNYKFSDTWKFRNNKYFIRKVDENYEVNYFYNHKDKKFESNSNLNQKEFKKRFNDTVSLADQVNSLLYAYFNSQENRDNQIHKFDTLRKYRNNVDFIHGRAESIYTKPILSKDKSEEAYKKTIDCLKLIKSIVATLEDKN